MGRRSGWSSGTFVNSQWLQEGKQAVQEHFKREMNINIIFGVMDFLWLDRSWNKWWLIRLLPVVQLSLSLWFLCGGVCHDRQLLSEAGKQVKPEKSQEFSWQQCSSLSWVHQWKKVDEGCVRTLYYLQIFCKSIIIPK